MCPGSPPGCGRGPQDLEPPETLPEPTAGRSVWIFGLGPRARLLPSPVPSRWSQQAARAGRDPQDMEPPEVVPGPAVDGSG